MTTDSILLDVKKKLGLEADYNPFDDEIIMDINTVLAKLTQAGIGPRAGFEITDDTQTWTDFVGTDPRLNMIKTYTALDVRMLFDPPQSGSAMEAMKEQIQEYIYRMNIHEEIVTQMDEGGG